MGWAGIEMCETIVNLDIVVPNQTRYLRFVGAIAEQLAKELDVPEETRDTLAFHLNLALTEAVANAIQYSSAANSLTPFGSPFRWRTPIFPSEFSITAKVSTLLLCRRPSSTNFANAAAAYSSFAL